MSKNKNKSTAPAADPVTHDELSAAASGLGLLIAVTTGAVVATPDGLRFADTDAGRNMRAALVPEQSGFLIGDVLHRAE